MLPRPLLLGGLLGGGQRQRVLLGLLPRRLALLLRDVRMRGQVAGVLVVQVLLALVQAAVGTGQGRGGGAVEAAVLVPVAAHDVLAGVGGGQGGAEAVLCDVEEVALDVGAGAGAALDGVGHRVLGDVARGLLAQEQRPAARLLAVVGQQLDAGVVGAAAEAEDARLADEHLLGPQHVRALCVPAGVPVAGLEELLLLVPAVGPPDEVDGRDAGEEQVEGQRAQRPPVLDVDQVVADVGAVVLDRLPAHGAERARPLGHGRLGRAQLALDLDPDARRPGRYLGPGFGDAGRHGGPGPRQPGRHRPAGGLEARAEAGERGGGGGGGGEGEGEEDEEQGEELDGMHGGSGEGEYVVPVMDMLYTVCMLWRRRRAGVLQDHRGIIMRWAPSRARDEDHSLLELEPAACGILVSLGEGRAGRGSGRRQLTTNHKPQPQAEPLPPLPSSPATPRTPRSNPNPRSHKTPDRSTGTVSSGDRRQPPRILFPYLSPVHSIPRVLVKACSSTQADFASECVSASFSRGKASSLNRTGYGTARIPDSASTDTRRRATSFGLSRLETRGAREAEARDGAACPADARLERASAAPCEKSAGSRAPSMLPGSAAATERSSRDACDRSAAEPPSPGSWLKPHSHSRPRRRTLPRDWRSPGYPGPPLSGVQNIAVADESSRRLATRTPVLRGLGAAEGAGEAAGHVVLHWVCVESGVEENGAGARGRDGEAAQGGLMAVHLEMG
ncbi:hypothetical protein BJ546DRAFT_946442 [Cryomyces antarcticus]